MVTRSSQGSAGMYECAIGSALLVLPIDGTCSLLPRAVQRLSADVALELRLRTASHVVGRGGLHGIAAVHGGSRHGGASGGEGQMLCDVEVVGRLCWWYEWGAAGGVFRMAVPAFWLPSMQQSSGMH